MKFVTAIQRDRKINDQVLPDVDGRNCLSDESTFEAASKVFMDIGDVSSKLSIDQFCTHFRSSSKNAEVNGLRDIFHLIDDRAEGSVGLLHVVDIVRSNVEVAAFLLPGVDCSDMLSSPEHFDMLRSLFEFIGHGKKRINFHDIEHSFF